MNLKKSDKIIAVIGVIILIVAAVGIIIYYEGEDKEDEVKEPEKELFDYRVVYDELSSQVTPDNTNFVASEKILKRIFGDGSYMGNIEVAADTLKKLEVVVEYTDNNRGPFNLGRIGLRLFGSDTLYVNLLDADGNEIAKGNIAGSGNVTLETSEMSPINIGIITAENEQDARDMLEENLSEMGDSDGMTMTYQIKVSLDEKELVFLRPIAWLLEQLRKDTFDMTVTQYYYDYSVEKIGDNDYDDNGEMSQMSQNGAESYNTMNYFGCKL
jgi:hypothetical protein